MTTAQVGSVFLKVTDMAAASDVLHRLFRFDEPEPGAPWVEIPGEVPIFVELVSSDTVLHDAEFGIRVEDAPAARERLDGHHVSDLFEVAPGVRGFHVADPGVQSLFIHE